MKHPGSRKSQVVVRQGEDRDWALGLRESAQRGDFRVDLDRGPHGRDPGQREHVAVGLRSGERQRVPRRGGRAEEVAGFVASVCQLDEGTCAAEVGGIEQLDGSPQHAGRGPGVVACEGRSPTVGQPPGCTPGQLAPA